MQNLESFSPQSKKNVLSNLLTKRVEITYDESDLPNGTISPINMTGTITFVGTSKFTFKCEDTEEEMDLSINGVIEFDTLREKKASHTG